MRVIALPILSLLTASMMARTFPAHAKPSEISPSDVNVLDYGADPGGRRDSSNAFFKAMSTVSDGGTIRVPPGTYQLDAAPWGTRFPNLIFQQALGVTYRGPGANILPYGQWAMGHVYSNGFLGVSGPNFFCDGTKQTKLLPGTEETICSNYELLTPSTGISHQLLAYMGTDNNENITSTPGQANWVETLNVTNNAHKINLQPSEHNGIPGASYVGIEIDMQADSTQSAQINREKGVYNAQGGAVAPNDVMDAGLLITGGGWPPPTQPELIGTAINIGRTQGAWFTSINAWNSRDGLVTNAYRYPIKIDTIYRGGNADPYCPTSSSGTGQTMSNVNGCVIQNGIYFDNVGGGGASGTILQAGQLLNGRPTLFLTRATDHIPSGQFLDFRSHAGDHSLFSVDVNGNMTTDGLLAAHGGSIQVDGPARRSRDIHFDTEGVERWELGANATSEDQPGTGSDLYISRRDNLGKPVDDPIRVNRQSGTVMIGDALALPGYPIAKLPTSPIAGELVMVTDAKSPLWGQTVKGGGNVRCLAMFNGSNWIAE